MAKASAPVFKALRADVFRLLGAADIDTSTPHVVELKNEMHGFGIRFAVGDKTLIHFVSWGELKHSQAPVLRMTVKRMLEELARSNTK